MHCAAKSIVGCIFLQEDVPAYSYFYSLHSLLSTSRSYLPVPLYISIKSASLSLHQHHLFQSSLTTGVICLVCRLQPTVTECTFNISITSPNLHSTSRSPLSVLSLHQFDLFQSSLYINDMSSPHPCLLSTSV